MSKQLTRDEAFKMVGIANVAAVEALNCEPTCRVGGNGLMHDDPYLEYAASANVSYDGLSPEQVAALPIGGCRIVAIYRASNEIEQTAIDADCDIWDFADVPIDHYRID